jgi:hypothetical protein
MFHVSHIISDGTSKAYLNIPQLLSKKDIKIVIYKSQKTKWMLKQRNFKKSNFESKKISKIDKT